MSRIGNKLITIPAGVEVTVAEGNEVTVKGPKGTLTRKFSPLMGIEVKDGTVTVTRPNEDKHTKQLHGTTRALIATMIEGCEKNYTKTLQIVGIGYRAAVIKENAVIKQRCILQHHSSEATGTNKQQLVSHHSSPFRPDMRNTCICLIPFSSSCT